jgi:hypothetical protein
VFALDNLADLSFLSRFASLENVPIQVQIVHVLFNGIPVFHVVN